MALASNNMDLLKLIFKYGKDIDINTTCTGGGSSMRTDSSRSWKPIHTAIEKGNYELTKLILNRGANINEYRTYWMQNEYGSAEDKQITALYQICKGRRDSNKMLKLLLNTHQQKYNGVPDVNKFNCYITRKQKPEEVYLKQKEAAREYLEDDEDSDDPRGGGYVDRCVNVYNFKTTIHIAVEKCDIEMLKLLLIYGGDTSLYYIVTQGGYGGGGRWGRRWQKSGGKTRDVLMREFHDGFIKEYKKTSELKMYQEVEDVFEILKKAHCKDDKIKSTIEKILKSGTKWFPEMIEYYPNNMGEALSVIISALENTLPVEITNIIIDYFYDIVEGDIKAAITNVDITNVQKE